MVKSLADCLNPGGKIRLIDIDGYMQNIFPQTSLIDECLKIFSRLEQIDLFVGRKLHLYLTQAKLENVTWEIQPVMLNTQDVLDEETALIRERFQNSLKTMAAALGSESKALLFQTEYLELLTKPGTCLFYNKFIATGEKRPGHIRAIER
jgi:hypothetical protein